MLDITSICETALYWLDSSTFCGQAIQATLQVLVWMKIFKFIKCYIKTTYSSSTWYLQGINKGDGEPEFLMLMIAIPQHTVSATFVWFGLYFNSLQLFSIGTLGEFAFEFIELYNILMAKYYYNNCPFKDEMVRSLIFHHLPGILTIIPTNIYFGDNIYIQKIAFSLLIVAPFIAFFFILHKTRNVYDLQQRGQFTVYFFLTILTLSVFRFYYTPFLMIQFLYNGFMDITLGMQIAFTFYGVLINLFNITFVIILCQRFYRWMYGNKCVIKKLKEPIQPRPIIQRCRSSPFHFDRSFTKKLN